MSTSLTRAILIRFIGVLLLAFVATAFFHNARPAPQTPEEFNDMARSLVAGTMKDCNTGEAYGFNIGRSTRDIFLLTVDDLDRWRESLRVRRDVAMPKEFAAYVRGGNFREVPMGHAPDLAVYIRGASEEESFVLGIGRDGLGAYCKVIATNTGPAGLYRSLHERYK